MGQRFANMDQGQRVKFALGIILFVAIAVAGLFMGRQAEWRVLYSNLADKDGGAVIAQLSTMNVPYKYTEGGGAIMVPADRVHDLRLKLASMGLPKSSVSGFEMMEANRFGMTQFQERLTFQRGLEGELTRSIQALSSVQNARVHLALPNQNGFFREQQKPSASIMLSLYPGRILDRTQLAGIVHLVASSVPDMSVASVSVLDDSGKLLSQPVDGSFGGALGAQAEQMQQIQQIEQLYARRILEILEPIVGKNNVRAQVTADLDFSQSEYTTETHKPNNTPDAAVIRSKQTVETGSGSEDPVIAGVPGASTNQQPTAAASPVNGAAQTMSAGGANGAISPGKRESIVNYEIDKTIKTVKGATGSVKRISAGVVVNNQVATDAKGKTTSTPLTQEQIDKITALVRETVGYSTERGDTVNVVNAGFAVEKVEVVEVPLWRQPEVLELVRSLGWPLGTLGMAMLVWFGVIRPALKPMAKTARSRQDDNENQLDAIEEDQPARPQLSGPTTPVDNGQPTPGQLRLEDARKLTRDNPAAVANIVKAWINGEVPA
jgi:flagellar M-ring protein FliF